MIYTFCSVFKVLFPPAICCWPLPLNRSKGKGQKPITQANRKAAQRIALAAQRPTRYHRSKYYSVSKLLANCIKNAWSPPKKTTLPKSSSHQVEMRGLEPLASSVQGRRSPKLSYIPKLPRINQRTSDKRWAFLDLNQRPFPYQRNALAD